MRPGQFQNNSANVGLADAKSNSKFILGAFGRTNFSNICFRKFRMIVIFTARWTRSVSTFKHHVFDVFSVGSDRKMFRIDARWIVARMHNLFSKRDYNLVSDHPRNTIGHVHFPSIMDAKEALADLVFGTSPYPTIERRRLANFIPKAILKPLVKHMVYIQRCFACFKSLVLNWGRGISLFPHFLRVGA